MKKTVLLVALAILLGSAQERVFARQTVLYEPGVDFPSPTFVMGALAGQDGWESAADYSTNAAQIVSYAAGQAIELFGPFVASAGTDFYDSRFIEPLANYDPVSEDTPVVSVSADIWMNLGPTAGQANWLYGFLILNDENGNAYESIGVDKNGLVFGQNFANPNAVVTSPNTGSNTFHVLRADLNFTTRMVRFFMDCAPMGSMPFNPAASGHLLGSVELVLQGSNPIDSNLLLDDLNVTAGTGVPAGACSLKITSAGPCLGDGTFGTPNVGDLYGVRVNFNVTNAPYAPFRIKFTIANVTWYSDDYSFGAGAGWYWYFDWYVNLDGPLPWSVTLDPDGLSGCTNAANMTASGTFTPTPPAVPLELYDPVTMAGVEQWNASFQPGSGTLERLYVAFGAPTTHGAQKAISVNGPSNAVYMVTAPYGAPAYFRAWTNVPAGTFQENETFAVQVNNMMVNPAMLRTNTWAQMSALPTNLTQWLAPDSQCQSASPAVSNFVQLYLPTNYQATMTPYDTARALQRAVMRSLVYLEPPPFGDATNCLRVGLADCGGYASLLTAALRHAGIPARRISGFWQGDSWQNDPQWHVRTEYYLPDTGWLITDACVGNECDPTGSYSWDFSFVPDANQFCAMDVGDQHILPNDNYTELQVPNWYYECCGTYISSGAQSYLQPLSALSVSGLTGGNINISVTNVPDLGAVYVQESTNLTAWTPVSTNVNPNESPLFTAIPTNNAARQFFRAVQIP